MANSCRSGDGDFKRRLAEKARARDPDLPYSVIAERVGASVRSVERWLSKGPESLDGAGYVRAYEPRRTPVLLDGLEELQDSDALTARPRNQAVATLCPDAL